MEVLNGRNSEFIFFYNRMSPPHSSRGARCLAAFLRVGNKKASHLSPIHVIPKDAFGPEGSYDSWILLMLLMGL